MLAWFLKGVSQILIMPACPAELHTQYKTAPSDSYPTLNLRLPLKLV